MNYIFRGTFTWKNKSYAWNLQQLDQQLLLTLNGLHSPYWDSFMWLFTGRFIWIPMYATILYILCKNFNVYVTLLTAVAIALTITYARSAMCHLDTSRSRAFASFESQQSFIRICSYRKRETGRQLWVPFLSCLQFPFGLAFFLLFSSVKLWI